MGRGRSGLSIRAAIKAGAERGRAKRREKEAREAAKIDLDNFVPVGVLLNQGEGALQKVLNSLTMDDLRKVISVNRLDPSKMTRRMKDLESLREFIMRKARQKASQGSAFRIYDK